MYTLLSGGKKKQAFPPPTLVFKLPRGVNVYMCHTLRDVIHPHERLKMKTGLNLTVSVTK